MAQAKPLCCDTVPCTPPGLRGDLQRLRLAPVAQAKPLCCDTVLCTPRVSGDDPQQLRLANLCHGPCGPGEYPSSLWC